MAKKFHIFIRNTFLQDILNGKFDSIEEARQFYSTNIYDKYEKNVRDNSKNSNAFKNLMNTYDDVRKIFIKPYIPSGPIDQTDEESTDQEGQVLKILTPKQMITRLPILLTQLKAGNNFEKLKNEIRQLVYSLYRSKNMSKKIYSNLVSTI